MLSEILQGGTLGDITQESQKGCFVRIKCSGAGFGHRKKSSPFEVRFEVRNRLNIDFENCYGIKKLKHEFSFSARHHTQLVYAPNGMMKTSFAKTLKGLSEQDRNL